MSSLPVPVSPRMSTVEPVGATVSTCLRTRRRAALSPDDILEVVLGASLLLQVGLLLGELVLQRRDLLEGQGVLDGHGHLVGNELQEAHVRRIVGGRLLAREHQRAQPPPGGGQRKPAEALDSIRLHSFQEPRPAP